MYMNISAALTCASIGVGVPSIGSMTNGLIGHVAPHVQSGLDMAGQAGRMLVETGFRPIDRAWRSFEISSTWKPIQDFGQTVLNLAGDLMRMSGVFAMASSTGDIGTQTLGVGGRVMVDANSGVQRRGESNQKLQLQAAVFDMDGVLTKTALVHAAAWAEVFNDFIRTLNSRDGAAYREFTHEDYEAYVDGKSRMKGVKGFLDAWGIDIPVGTSEDAPEAETHHGLAKRKNAAFNHVLASQGAEKYEDTIAFIRHLREQGIPVGVVSSSANCQAVCEAADILDLFDSRVDGVVAKERGYVGKPDGDIFVVATKELNTSPSMTIMIEDAISGVQAGRNGLFRLVLGYSPRGTSISNLTENGADIVVKNFDSVTDDRLNAWFAKGTVSLEEAWSSSQALNELYAAFNENAGFHVAPQLLRPISESLQQAQKRVFIVDEEAIRDLSAEQIAKLTSQGQLAVIGKGDRSEMTQVPGAIMIGNDGLDIPGVDALTIYYHGDYVRGYSYRALMQALDIDSNTAVVVMSEDESLLTAVRGRGIPILVSNEDRPSAADVRVESVLEFVEFI